MGRYRHEGGFVALDAIGYVDAANALNNVKEGLIMLMVVKNDKIPKPDPKPTKSLVASPDFYLM